MSLKRPQNGHALNLRAGELVQVRSEAEILSTLDANGRLDALPFMPEMLQYCGQRFRVYKRAHKTCDTIDKTGGRRMRNTVHLADLRCDGTAHGGCQARCLIFWKEAWLERVDANLRHRLSSRIRNLFQTDTAIVSSTNGFTTRQALFRATLVHSENVQPGEEVYSCQATDLLKASAPLAWWDFRQYVEDLTSGNVSFLQILSALLFFAVKHGLEIGVGYRAQLWIYNRFQRMIGGCPYPFRVGQLLKTPTETLNLKVGELVQVKTNEEILATLDKRSKNRGLFFDYEEAAYCGSKHRVLQRVERIIDENTGKMKQLPGECIMLEGVTCGAQYSDRRIFCPRSIYSYWREIWLRRAE